jgi:hypothetical protein
VGKKKEIAKEGKKFKSNRQVGFYNPFHYLAKYRHKKREIHKKLGKKRNNGYGRIKKKKPQ